MNLAEIRQLAEELLDKHALEGWTVRFDRARRRAGGCLYSSRTITLSSTLLPTYPAKVVRDVILHEIAHALVGADHHHDSVWKSVAAEIGATPKASLAGDLPAPSPNWVGRCPKCTVTKQLYSAPRRVVSCGACSHVFDTSLILLWEHHGESRVPPGRYAQQLRRIRTQTRRA